MSKKFRTSQSFIVNFHHFINEPLAVSDNKLVTSSLATTRNCKSLEHFQGIVIAEGAFESMSMNYSRPSELAKTRAEQTSLTLEARTVNVGQVRYHNDFSQCTVEVFPWNKFRKG